MPIYLEGPSYDPRGPDGDGRNRLRIDSIDPQPRCALRPRTFAGLRESMNTAIAQWGSHFDVCSGGGECSACFRFTRRHNIQSPPDALIVRLHPDGSLHYTSDVKAGWNASLTPIAWDDLASLEEGWSLGRVLRDEHSQYIPLNRARPR
uniref:hypothetical protein n=1 Tax=Pseudomonas aeruginosa TaxID=287 RepID=UPI001F1A554C|nr:hypothetical protein [Pseudomonas aeruginosa]